MMMRVAEKAAAAPVKPKNLMSSRLTGMLTTAVTPVTAAGGHIMHCACSACMPPATPHSPPKIGHRSRVPMQRMHCA